jgi:hypothetical protein
MDTTQAVSVCLVGQLHCLLVCAVGCSAVLHRYCPLLDMMLKGKDRGVGSCTDAAVYALYAGARIIPMPQGEHV